MLLQAISAMFSVSGDVKQLEAYLNGTEFRNQTHADDPSENPDMISDMVTLDRLVLNVPPRPRTNSYRSQDDQAQRNHDLRPSRAR